MQEAFLIQEQLTTVLLSAGFILRKWSSNHDALLSRVEKLAADTELVNFNKNDTAFVRTLGLGWNPSIDKFDYKLESLPQSNKITKRFVVSCIARLFDPLGLLSPIIIKAKILMQELWLQKIEWDTQLPQALRDKWNNFIAELPDINNILVPRNICYHGRNAHVW